MLEGAGRSVTQLYTVAENRPCAARPAPRGLTPDLKTSLYPSGRPLHPPKTRTTSNFPASCLAAVAGWERAAVDAPPLPDYWPVPESLTFCGLPEALCVMVRAPGIVPDCAGVNVTSRVQVL